MSNTGRELERLFITGGGLLGPRSRDSELIGSRIGVYEIVDVLGRGGMATVYLAERRDEAFEQRVAIKVLEIRSVGGRFSREQRILAHLDHPAIARIFDGGILPDGRPYIVMEYVSGDPISAAFRDEPFGRRLDWLEQICEALQAAHREEIVHLDLKPDNILIDRHGMVKLLDFGIAGWHTDHARGSLELMTPRFAAPEQFEGAGGTVATDVFQLGLLLYLAATDRHAAGDVDDAGELRQRVSHLPLVPASKEAAGDVRPTLDREFDQIVGRCLRTAPDERYAEVSDLLSDLRAWRKGRATSATAGRVTPAARRLWRRHPWMVAGTFAGVAIVAIAAFWIRQEFRRVETRSQAMSELANDMVSGEAADRIANTSFELTEGSVSDDPQLERELAFLTAQALLNAGRSDEALAMLEAVVSRARGSFEESGQLAGLFYLLGEAYRQVGRTSEAARYLKAAEPELALGQPVLWRRNVRSLAAALVQAGRLDEAAQVLGRAAHSDSEDSELLASQAPMIGTLTDRKCDGLKLELFEDPLRSAIAEWCAGPGTP